jgi:hypothetical protein
MLQPFLMSVDFKHKKVIEEPVVTQLDDVIFVVSIFDNDVPAEINGLTYRFVSRRPDGKSYYADGVKTGVNEVTFDLGKPEVTLIGNVEAVIQLFDSNQQRLSSFKFNYTVIEDISLSDTITDQERTLLEIVVEDGPGLVDYFKQAEPMVKTLSDYASVLNQKADLTYVNAKVTALASGSPIAVSLASNMTDNTRNYVYLGSEAGYTPGHWYGWNGTAWVDGGLYQSAGIDDSSIATSKLADGAVTAKKTKNLQIKKILNTHVTEDDYIGVWNGTSPTDGTVAITNNQIYLNKIKTGNYGLLLGPLYVGDFDNETIYINMSFKNPNVGFDVWIFSESNALIKSMGGASGINTDWKYQSWTITKTTLASLGITDGFRLCIVGNDTAAGEFWFKDLTVNSTNLPRSVMKNVFNIDTVQYKDKSVTTTKIADKAVTTLQIGDKAVTEGQIGDGAVSNKKISKVSAKKVLNTLISEDDYIGLWNENTPASTVTISDNYMKLDKPKVGNVGLIFNTMKLSDLSDTFYIRAKAKNTYTVAVWIFSATNALVSQVGTFPASPSAYTETTVTVTKQALLNASPGLTDVRLALVGSASGADVIEITDLFLNNSLTRRELTSSLQDINDKFTTPFVNNQNVLSISPEKIVNSRAAFSAFSMWGTNAPNTLQVIGDELVYNKQSTGDSGVWVTVDLTDQSDLETVYLSFESIVSKSNNGGMDMSLWTDTGAYKASLGAAARDHSYTSQVIKIDKGLLSRYGLGKKFKVSINLHSANTWFRLRNLSISNVHYGEHLRKSVNKLFTDSKIRKTKKFGQAVDFSDSVNYTPVTVTGHHFVTPDSYSDGDYVIKEVTAYVPTTGNYTFTVGIIDQNSLIVNQKDFVLGLSAGYNTYDVESKNIAVPASNRVFMDISSFNKLYQPVDVTKKYVDVLVQDDATTINTGSYNGMTMHAPSNATYMLPFSYTLVEKSIGQQVSELNTNVAALQAVAPTLKDGYQETITVKPDGSKSRIVVDNNGLLTAVDLIPSKVSVFGNSLTAGFGTQGMAASTVDKDYYALLKQYLLSKNPSLRISARQTASAWEGFTTSADRQNWWDTTGINFVQPDDDLVIIQLVDNVNTPEKDATFAEDAKTLVTNVRKKAPKARVVWVAGWYVDSTEMGYIKDALKERGGLLADITPYNQDAIYKNAVGNTYVTGDGVTHTITDPGVASHPGDLGHQKIFETIRDVLAL